MLGSHCPTGTRVSHIALTLLPGRYCYMALLSSDRFGAKEPFRADFIQQHLKSAVEVPVPVEFATIRGIDVMRRAHLKSAFELVPPEMQSSGSLFMEFGVRAGESISFLANLTGSLTWDGFDSFEGLPATNMSHSKTQQSWRKGEYTMRGKLPRVPGNVRLHRGWYSNTLPRFLDNAISRGVTTAAFVHLDAGKSTPLHMLLCRFIPWTLDVRILSLRFVYIDPRRSRRVDRTLSCATWFCVVV